MPSATENSIIRLKIDSVSVHDLFVLISEGFGYSFEDDKHTDEIAALADHWTQQGFVEVYKGNADRKYGRVKDSNVPGSSPWYIDLFHARLSPSGDNDPLVVLTFNKVADVDQVEVFEVTLRFMVDHDRMFGTFADKMNQARMKAIRKRIDAFIQQQNAHNAAQAVGE